MTPRSLVPLVFLGACASSTRIQIESSQATNEGRSFYFMARQADEGQLVGESYTEAAQRVFGREKSPDVLVRRVVLPGRPLVVDLKEEVQGDLLLYFFFTDPTEDWLPLTIERERLPGAISVELGRRRVLHHEVR